MKYLILIIISFIFSPLYSQSEITYDKIYKKHLKSDYDDLILVKKDGLLGLLGTNGSEITSPKYEYIGKFKNRGPYDIPMALVKKDGKIGLIDTTGYEIIKAKYDKLYKFKESEGEWIKYKLDGQFGFLDFDGNQVIN